MFWVNCRLPANMNNALIPMQARRAITSHGIAGDSSSPIEAAK